jgi:hypothetical protein
VARGRRFGPSGDRRGAATPSIRGVNLPPRFNADAMAGSTPSRRRLFFFGAGDMTDVTEAVHLRAQVAALIAERKTLDDVMKHFIETASAAALVLRDAAPVLAPIAPALAARADQIVAVWSNFMAGVSIAKAAAELQNAPSSDARQ